VNNGELVALVREDITTVDVVFCNQVNGQQYTFFCCKDIADELEIDARVLVDTANGVSLALVRNVENKIGTGILDTTINYKYIFDRVDLNQLHDLKAKNNSIEKVLSASRRDSARQQALEAMGIPNIDQLRADVSKLVK